MKKNKTKKMIIASLLAGCLCFALPFSVSAASAPETATAQTTAVPVLISESTEILANGDSITTKLYETTSTVQLYATSYTKTGSKSIEYKDSSGKKLWVYKVTGTFKVEPGVRATCTSVVAVPSVYNSSWSVYSNVPSRSGNTAKGVVTMQKKSGSTVVQKVTKTVTVQCSKNGVIS